MIKHIWTLVCKEAKVEAETNNMSIIDVLENIQFAANMKAGDLKANEGKPFMVPMSLQVVSVFFRDTKHGEDEFECKVRVIDPSNKQLGEFNAPVKFQEGLNRMRNIMKFDSLAVTESGTYLFQIFMKNDDKLKNVVSVPVDIQLNITTV